MKLRLHHLTYAILVIGIIVRICCWPINPGLGILQRFAGSATLCVPYLLLTVTAWITRRDMPLALLVLLGSCAAVGYAALFDFDHLRRQSKESGFDALEIFQQLAVIGLFAAVVLGVYAWRRGGTRQSKS